MPQTEIYPLTSFYVIFLSFFFHSNHVLCSRNSTSHRTSTATRIIQPHHLNANQWHVQLIDIKYCENTRPGQQLEAAQRQHADLCKSISGKAVKSHTLLLGVGVTCCNDKGQLKKLGLDHQRASKLARELHAHFLKYAHKLATTWCAIMNKNNPHSHVLESIDSSNPSDPP
eukprot:1147305-Pelagomonas_calceolata.AAC.2